MAITTVGAFRSDEARARYAAALEAAMAVLPPHVSKGEGYVLEVGSIVLDGPGRELMTNDAVRKAYLGED